MAPFKLKFRMGSGSRSTSQEIEEPVQQPLLTRQSSICDSSTTIDSEFTSMSSTNDQHNLLPNKFDEETGKRPFESMEFSIIILILLLRLRKPSNYADHNRFTML